MALASSQCCKNKKGSIDTYYHALDGEAYLAVSSLNPSQVTESNKGSDLKPNPLPSLFSFLLRWQYNKVGQHLDRLQQHSRLGKVRPLPPSSLLKAISINRDFRPGPCWSCVTFFDNGTPHIWYQPTLVKP